MHTYIHYIHKYIYIYIQRNIHRVCPSVRHNQIEDCKYKVVLGSKTGHIVNVVVLCIENRTPRGQLNLPPSLGYEESQTSTVTRLRRTSTRLKPKPVPLVRNGKKKKIMRWNPLLECSAVAGIQRYIPHASFVPVHGRGRNHCMTLAWIYLSFYSSVSYFTHILFE